MTDVPAYVHQPTIVVNQVVVTGGNNWDLSRTAAPTPIELARPAQHSSQPGDLGAFARVTAVAPVTRLTFTYATGATKPAARVEGALNALQANGTWLVRIERGTNKAETTELQMERLAHVRGLLAGKANSAGFVAEVVDTKAGQSRLVVQQVQQEQQE